MISGIVIQFIDQLSFSLLRQRKPAILNETIVFSYYHIEESQQDSQDVEDV